MLRIARTGIIWILAVIALLSVPVAMAKKPDDTPSAPIPVQVLSAKRVFISYGESDADP